MNGPASPIEFSLLNDFQRDFPLRPNPWRDIGARLGVGEEAVLAGYQRLLDAGAIGRIGVVVAPRRIGSSTLAALAVPPESLETAAAAVGRHPEVNHNYEREHGCNLWFVATARNDMALAAVLGTIEAETGCRVLSLPLVEEFHIDLGFDLGTPGNGRLPQPARSIAGSGACAMPDIERRLLQALQDGLDLVPRPFAQLGSRAGISEALALEIIERWLADGVLKRFGVVVRHRELGFTANAMCVWDVPDDAVHAAGLRLAAEAAVTLCYRRSRALPTWPYNLFCMIHGRERTEVEGQRNDLARRLGLDAYPHAVLFSRRSFKQTAAHYGGTDDHG